MRQPSVNEALDVRQAHTRRLGRGTVGEDVAGEALHEPLQVLVVRHQVGTEPTNGDGNRCSIRWAIRGSMARLGPQVRWFIWTPICRQTCRGASAIYSETTVYIYKSCPQKKQGACLMHQTGPHQHPELVPLLFGFFSTQPVGTRRGRLTERSGRSPCAPPTGGRYAKM